MENPIVFPGMTNEYNAYNRREMLVHKRDNIYEYVEFVDCYMSVRSYRHIKEILDEKIRFYNVGGTVKVKLRNEIPRTVTKAWYEGIVDKLDSIHLIMPLKIYDVMSYELRREDDNSRPYESDSDDNSDCEDDYVYDDNSDCEDDYDYDSETGEF